MHVLQADADAQGAVGGLFRDVIGLAAMHVQRQDGHPGAPCVVEQEPPRVHARVMGQDAGQELRAVMGLEPRRAIRRHGERGRMRFAESEARELRHVVPRLFGRGRIDASADRTLKEIGTQPREHLGVVQVPPHMIGVGEVVAGQRRQRADHLFVEDDHPEGLLERGRSAGCA